jgi:pilus assembly protein CpaB
LVYRHSHRTSPAQGGFAVQRRNLIIVGIAVFLGAIAVILANSYFSGVEERQEQIAEEQRLARIIVATQPMEFGELLTTENIRLQNWPAQSVPEGAFLTVADALKDNRVALRPIVPGEPILASKVSGTDGRATLAALLPDGMRAVSIPVNNVNGVAGFVLPGTTVDILLVRKIEGDGADSQDMRADLLMENVQVLAVDQLANDKQGEPKISRVATLAVTPYDAQRLAVANRMGTLQLTLRKVESASLDDPVQGRLARTVTSRQLGVPRIVIPGSRSSGGGGNVSSAPAMASHSPPAVASASINIPAYSGPAMTVVRGTEPTNYQVGPMGGGLR